MTKGCRVALSALVLMVGGVACSKDDPNKNQVVLILVDVSASSDDPEIRDRYLAYTESIIDGVSDSGGGRILIDVIDDNPLAHSEPIGEAIAGCDPLTENRLTCQNRIDQQQEALLTATQNVLTQTTRGTDILGALDVAERVFQNYPEARNKYLVLFSDMVQSAQDIHFAKVDWDEAAVTEVMTKAEPLPDLASVGVYIAGAGTIETDRLNAEQIQGMKTFWLDYFSQTGAALPEARYGSALIRFP